LLIIVISVVGHIFEEDEGKKVLVSRLNLAGKVIYPAVLVGFLVMIGYLNFDLIMGAM